MPIPDRSELEPVVTERVLVFTVSHALYSTWAIGWADCLKLEPHETQLLLLNWLIEKCRRISVVPRLEVVKKKGKEDTSHYRLWIPLAANEQNLLTAEMTATLQTNGKKRKFMDDSTETFPFTKLDLLQAMRVYCKSAYLVGIETGPVEKIVPPNHIFALLDPSGKNGVRQELDMDERQSALSTYFCENCFVFPDWVIQENRVYVLTSSIINKPHGLLDYALPMTEIRKTSANKVLTAIKNATGSDHVSDEKFEQSIKGNPAAFMKLIQEASANDMDIRRGLIDTKYNVIALVRSSYEDKFRRGDYTKDFITDVNVLFSDAIPGVPTVYHEMMSEMRDRMEQLCSPTPDADNAGASAYFFQAGSPEYTPFGNILRNIATNAKCAFTLQVVQYQIWWFLYLSSFSVPENSVTASKLDLISGPPELGKTVVANAFLDCIPSALRITGNITSAKAYTFHKDENDLRIRYEDELSSILLGSDADVKANQSLLTDGVIITERVVQSKSDGGFSIERNIVVRRTMFLTNTNTGHKIPRALDSRSNTVPFTPQQRRTNEPSASDLATTSKQQHLLPAAPCFKKYCQLMVSLIGGFWAYHAAGGIPEMEDRLFTVFKSIYNTYNLPEIPPRKLDGIRRIARSLMVLELVKTWYTQSPQERSDAVKELIYYRENTVYKMEHVVAAVEINSSTTSMRNELRSVKLALRSLIKTDENGLPEYSPCRKYFVLRSAPGRLKDDLTTSLATMGEGNALSLLAKIREGHTNRLPNIRTQRLDNTDVVLLNVRYCVNVTGEIETTILSYLESIRETEGCLSWDEKYIVYRAPVRNAIEEGQFQVGIANEPIELRRFALEMLSLRQTRSGELMWISHDEVDISEIVVGTTTGAIAMRNDPNKFKVKRKQTNCLAVHMSLFQPDGYEEASTLHRCYARCLGVAGYNPNKKIVVNMAHEGPSKVVTVSPERGPFSVKALNFLYSDNASGVSASVNDIIFPRDKQHVTFTEKSNLEEKLFAERKKYVAFPTPLISIN